MTKKTSYTIAILSIILSLGSLLWYLHHKIPWPIEITLDGLLAIILIAFADRVLMGCLELVVGWKKKRQHR